jgi:hypothetical protein
MKFITDVPHLLSILAFLLAPLVLPLNHAAAQDIAIDCPPGWLIERDGQMLQRCTAPGRDAFLEIYAYDHDGSDLASALSRFTEAMSERGMPFHQFRKESPGDVSGRPALTREFTGEANGVLFHSFVSVSSHAGKTYVLQALYLADRTTQLQPEIRAAMNSWRFPSIAAESPAPAATPTLSGARSFENRGQCLNTLCVPALRDCKEGYDFKDRRYQFRYRLCEFVERSCRGYCDAYWHLALQCTKEAIGAALGYWQAACVPVSYDAGEVDRCFRPKDGETLSRLQLMAKSPECKVAR